MEEKALQVFSYEGLQLRTIEEDGVVWFVAKDIAIALGYSYWQPNIDDSCAGNLEGD